jgi:hypothetical protein
LARFCAARPWYIGSCRVAVRGAADAGRSARQQPGPYQGFRVRSCVVSRTAVWVRGRCIAVLIGWMRSACASSSDSTYKAYFALALKDSTRPYGGRPSGSPRNAGLTRLSSAMTLSHHVVTGQAKYSSGASCARHGSPCSARRWAANPGWRPRAVTDRWHRQWIFVASSDCGSAGGGENATSSAAWSLNPASLPAYRYLHDIGWSDAEANT